MRRKQIEKPQTLTSMNNHKYAAKTLSVNTCVNYDKLSDIIKTI